jgi:hypothetical protein
MVYDLMGTGFDYLCLPADGASGGIIVAWSRDVWSVSRTETRQFTVTIDLCLADVPGTAWSLCAVYGPVDEGLKPEFLSELRAVHDNAAAQLLLCGDFNMIYQAQDKSNTRLNLAAMRRFRRALDAMAVDELYLQERNDRTFSQMASAHPGLLQKVIKEASDWVLEGFKTLSVFCSLVSQNSVVM